MAKANINELPNEVLAHILSFLPTEVAVTTSLVSKKWRSIPSLAPNVDLDEHGFLARHGDVPHRFREFVSSIFQNQNRRSIERLRLSSMFASAEEVEEWVTLAIQRHVQFLTLKVGFELPLPNNMFSSVKLVELTIEFGKFQDASHIHLPSLKTLVFDQVTFLNTGVFLRLLSGCPKLQKLVATGFFQETKVLTEDQIPILGKLEVVGLSFVGDLLPREVFSNANICVGYQCLI